MAPRVDQDRFGFLAALMTAAMTTVTFAIAVSTPPRSGPFCREGCFSYPYLDVASRFPRDYAWMAAASVAIMCYLGMMSALHARSAATHRASVTLALMIATMAAIVLVGDYFVQLAVIQPSLIAAEADGVAMLSQFNPHGVFIALEELGFLLMSASLACVAPSMPRDTAIARAAGALFVGGLVVNLLLFGGIVALYGHAREYRFEVAVISVTWLVLIAGATLLAVHIRRASNAAGR
jgi:hypothetical protein